MGIYVEGHPIPRVYLGGRTEAKNKFKRNMVMLHIKLKWNDACRNMVATILPSDTRLTVKVGLKGQQKSLKVVQLHIKLKGMERRAPCRDIFSPDIHLFISASSHVAYQIKGKAV